MFCFTWLRKSAKAVSFSPLMVNITLLSPPPSPLFILGQELLLYLAEQENAYKEK